MSGFGGHAQRGAIVFAGVYLAIVLPPIMQLRRLELSSWPWTAAVSAVGVMFLVFILSVGVDEAMGCGATVLVVVGAVVGRWLAGPLPGTEVDDPRAGLIGTLSGPVLILAAWSIVLARRKLLSGDAPSEAQDPGG